MVNYHEVKRETDLFGDLGKIYYYLISKIFDKIFVHTTEAKKILIFGCKVNKSKIKVIPHGTYEFKNKNDFSKEIIRKFGLKDKKIILYFGYIHVDKGIQYLLEASKILLKQNPKLNDNYIVLISGIVRPREGLFKIFEKKDQTYLKNLLNLKNELGLNSFVKFTGFIEDKYMYSLLNLAKVIVLPYTNVEQSGVLNLALAVHKPVVASEIGGLKETLQKAGILVPPANSEKIANSILQLFEDKKYYNDIVRQYKELNYIQSTKNITKNLINEYKSLIKY
jgi:glycosyltransferase involved in cell wall biosynthesis